MMTTTNENGFTLIEALIAMVILALGIFALYSMQMASIQGNGRAARVTSAATWGADRLETLMTLDYDDPDLTDNNDTGANAGVTGLDNTDTAGSEADSGPEVEGPFTIYWNVADDYPAFGTKTVRVLIQHNVQGVVKTVTQEFIMQEPI